MQISRHWRLNSQRYRLQGVRYEDGKVSLQDRPTQVNLEEQPQSSEKQSMAHLARKPVAVVA